MSVNVLIPQGPNLRQKEAGDNEQQRTNSIAKSKLRHLRDILAEQNDDLAEQKKQSNCLQKIKTMPSNSSPCSES